MNGDLFTQPPAAEKRQDGPIAHIYKLSTGKVVCFDARAQELKEFGGEWEEMKALINANVATNVRVHE